MKDERRSDQKRFKEAKEEQILGETIPKSEEAKRKSAYKAEKQNTSNEVGNCFKFK